MQVALQLAKEKEVGPNNARDKMAELHSQLLRILDTAQVPGNTMAIAEFIRSLPDNIKQSFTQVAACISDTGQQDTETVATTGSAMSFFMFGDQNAVPFRLNEEVDEDGLRTIATKLFDVKNPAECKKLRNGFGFFGAFLDGMAKLAGLQFHYTARYWYVMASNRLSPQDHPLQYKSHDFWGNNNEECLRNAGDFVLAMFFGLSEGEDGNAISITFAESLKERFTLDV